MFVTRQNLIIGLGALVILASCKEEGGGTGLFAPPPNPFTVTATTASTTQINLSWTDGGETTTDYRIAYQTGATAPSDCETGTTIGESSISGTAHSVTGLTDDTQYAFRVCAINGNPFPDASSGDTDTATTFQVPPPDPTSPTATVDSTTQITLSWTSGGGSTTDYRISYQLGTGAPANCATGTQISEAAITGTSHPITGLSAGRDYAFRVCAINGNPTPDVSSGVTVSDTAWWDTNWKRRRKISFNNAARGSNLDNFPVMVKLTDPTNVEYAQTQDAGEDIRFIDADSTTTLDYEIELWNEAGDSYVWVEVPRINASVNFDHIWFYYGNTGAADAQNASGTWNADYRAVWHFNQNPVADPPDSTGYNHLADLVGDTAAGIVSAFTGPSFSFDGAGDWVQVHDQGGGPTPWTNLDFTGDVTLEGWFYLDSNFTSASGTTFPLLEKHIDDTEDVSIALIGTDYLRAEVSDGALMFRAENCPADTAPCGGQNRFYKWTNTVSWTASTWYYFAAVLDDNNLANTRIYINGTNDTDATDVDETNAAVIDTQFSANVDWGIGGQDIDQVASVAKYFAGDLDEFRISNRLQNADWINAQYSSMTGALNSFSSVQSVP